MRNLGVVALFAFVLVGCQSDDNSFYNAPKALDKMTPEERCAFYAHYVSNPDLSPSSKKVAIEEMRAKGCPAP